jgi:hypothetical protein
MDENLENTPQQDLPEEQNLPSAPEPDISISDAMTGVLSEPGDTYEAVKQSVKRSYWVWPTIIFIVITLISTFLVMRDDELYSDIKTKQTKAMRERFEEQVKAGKMSQEQMNETMDKMDQGFNRSSPFFIISTTIGPAISILIILFLKGLIIWLIFKAFKGTASYMLVICVLGLANIIQAMQSIIDTVLAILMGKLQANIGPVLIFTAESIGDSMFKFMSHFDLFNIWYLIVIGIGIAKVSNLKSSVSISVIFALWLVWVAFTSFLKIPFFAM